MKGVEVLIQAFERYRECDLLIAGDGTHEADLRYLARGLSHVRFLGRLNYECLQTLLRDAIAVVVPSVGYEVFGMVILEAFAQKTPVIVHNLGALPELVEQSGGGLIYDDEAGLVEALETLRSTPALRRSFGRQGYQAYLKHWTPEAHLRQYFELIERTAEAKGATLTTQEVLCSMRTMKDNTENMLGNQVVVIGGGPAGLTAAHELVNSDLRPVILEKADKVGGLSRTENYKGFYFDMGGHRFFTKAKEVEKMWYAILGDDFLRRPRMSRIYYNRKFFYYPLKPLDALLGLGLWQSVLAVLSYLRWQLFWYRCENTFEQWVTNRFGKRLFLTFFKTYTEKVWGIPCSELKAEWAAQRIKDLSLRTALFSTFLKPKTTIKTLIEEFDYPRLGPGMMWNAVKDEIERRNGVVRLNSDVVRINRTGNHIDSVVISCGGREEVIHGTDFISSMPVTELVKKLYPTPLEATQAAEKLTYRDFLTVCLILDKPHLFPDNWIYIHSPEVKVGRIQNFKNWSPDMVPDPTKTSLGMEYFCTEEDELWNMPDADLIELGKREVKSIGLASYADVEDGCVFRVPKAYPMYDSDYRDYLAIVREFVDGLENLQTIGRNGLHRYNNQDHAMLTGMLAARNLTLGEQNNLWSVNVDQEYHEEIRGEEEVEEHEVVETVQQTLTHVFSKLDTIAFGLSTGISASVILFLMTLILLLKDGTVVGPTLGLLNQFFPGYSVTPLGGALGLIYGFTAGFVGGSVFAFLRNAAVLLSMIIVERRVQLKSLWDLF